MTGVPSNLIPFTITQLPEEFNPIPQGFLLYSANGRTSKVAISNIAIAGTGTVTEVRGVGEVNGITLTGTVTADGELTLGGSLSDIDLTSQITGILPIENGGTNAATVVGARSNLGATTVGSSLFTLPNPSSITFLRLNANNTVSALSAADFRTAIGAGTGNGNGTVTSVSGTGTINGISLSGTVSTTGNLSLTGSLSGVNLTTQVTGTLPIANGGTNATTAANARTNLGASTLGANIFTLANPSAVTFPQFNVDNSVSTLTAAAMLTALGSFPAASIITGSFSPTLVASPAYSSISYGTDNSGFYVKFPGFYLFSARIQVASATGGGGSLLMGNLPFTSTAGSQAGGGSVVYKGGWTTRGPDAFYANVASNTAVLTATEATVTANIASANSLGGSDTIMFGIIFL